jgi:hypothetical protein
MSYLLGLAVNCDPPELCLLSGEDYRHEPPVPGSMCNFYMVIPKVVIILPTMF